jgi:hypothetical protein
VLGIALLILISQVVAPITRIPPVVELLGVFVSPIRPRVWLNVTIALQPPARRRGELTLTSGSGARMVMLTMP